MSEITDHLIEIRLQVIRDLNGPRGAVTPLTMLRVYGLELSTQQQTLFALQ